MRVCCCLFVGLLLLFRALAVSARLGVTCMVRMLLLESVGFDGLGRRTDETHSHPLNKIIYFRVSKVVNFFKCGEFRGW